jgi:quinolinate synthase
MGFVRGRSSWSADGSSASRWRLFAKGKHPPWLIGLERASRWSDPRPEAIGMVSMRLTCRWLAWPILFAPDQNLLRWVQRQSGRELTLWPGTCIVHETFSEQPLLQLKLEHPGAEVLAHPECQQHLLDLADFIGSTSKLLHRAEASLADSFIVLTKLGILHQMRKAVPDKAFYEVPGADGCSCNACPYMRLNTLEKLWRFLQTMQPEILMDEGLRQRALASIRKMLEMSR